MNWIGFRRKWL